MPCLIAGPSAASAQTGENVLLVVNGVSGVSQEIGARYAALRGVPDTQVIRIEVPDTDVVPRAVYQERIERPLGEWLNRHAAHDRILYIVLTKGIPVRVEGTSGRTGTGSSVDSELTLLYRKLTGQVVTAPGPIPNPYYLGASAVASARRFTHREHDIFLVTRLDGFTGGDVLRLLDRGIAPSTEGSIVLDQKADLSNQAGEALLETAAKALREQGYGERTVLESTTRAFSGTQPVLGYYSWGSNDAALRARTPGLVFSPGAIAATFLSADARTFREPPPQWKAGSSLRREGQFAGSSQGLLADLIRAGVTGAAGYVAEPYGDGAVRPDVLFSAYLSGFNVAESFYLATPFLSWQSVVVGDPLCAPFARDRAGADDVHGGLDPTTELPSFFSGRRLTTLATNGLDLTAVQQLLRAEARTARDDTAGARSALETATAREPRLLLAQFMLASIHERAAEYDLAIERYQTILKYTPNNPVALNNLAYGLAVRRNQPQEALPFARKAFTLMKAVSSADTLGWVLHLTGDHAGAAALFNEVVRAPVEDAEVLLHAAIVFASVGRPDAAARELQRAIALDATMESRNEVKDLRAKIEPRKGQ